MRAMKVRILTGLFGLWMTAGIAAIAQDKEEQFRLDVDLGYRWEAMFRGSRDLYRSHLDLGEGPKLFHTRLFWAPASGEDKYLDRLELQLSGWGGEPYNTAWLRMGKADLYDFSFRYQNAHYFSSIPSFANPGFASGDLVSQHREDNSLRTATLDLRLWPGRKWSPFLSYQRTTHFGRVDTTFGAPGDEFSLLKDLQYRADDLRGGLILQGTWYTLTLQQGARWYRDSSTWDAFSFQEGNSSRNVLGRPVILENGHFENRFRSRAVPYSIASLVLQPHERLTFRGRVSYWMADLRSRFYEDVTGSFVAFFEPRGFFERLEQSAWAQTKRPEVEGEFQAEVRFTEALSFVQHVRVRRSHLDSVRVLERLFGNLEMRPSGRFFREYEDILQSGSFVGYNRDDSLSEFRVKPHRTVELHGGYRLERRELELPPLEPGSFESQFQPGGFKRAQILRRFQVDRDVLVLGGTWRPRTGSRLTVEYEKGWSDAPIYRLDVTDFDRLRINGSTDVWSDFQVYGNVRLLDNDEELVDFASENRGYGAGFRYQVGDEFGVSGEWQRSRWETSIPYVQPQTLTWDLFTFRELSDYGRLAFDVILPQRMRLELGYAVWGNVGDYPINFHQPVAKLEIPFGERVTGYAQWNYYDYNEKITLFPQDYRSHLVTFGVRTVLTK